MSERMGMTLNEMLTRMPPGELAARIAHDKRRLKAREKAERGR